MKTEIALELIKLKIPEEIKNNKETNLEELRRKILELENESKQIYYGNEEIVNKVLSKYKRM